MKKQMISKKVKQAFEECERFIDECTPEELLKYEKSLNIDSEDYESDILMDGIAREFGEYEVVAWKPLPEPLELKKMV